MNKLNLPSRNSYTVLIGVVLLAIPILFGYREYQSQFYEFKGWVTFITALIFGIPGLLLLSIGLTRWFVVRSDNAVSQRQISTFAVVAIGSILLLSGIILQLIDGYEAFVLSFLFFASGGFMIILGVFERFFRRHD